MRVPGVHFLLLALLTAAGCRSVPDWDDLSAPAEWTALDAPAVAVVTNGVALPVVTDDSPRHYRAAWFLADTIEEMTGCRPRLYVASADRSAAVPAAGFFVGVIPANAGWTCPLAAESPEAFRVVVSNGCVRFLGRADYAVFDWCERALGLRFYCTDGKCVERRTAVVAEAADYSDRPVFDCRQLGGGDSVPWLRFARAGGSHRGGVAVHQPAGWWTNATVRAEAPDIFETGTTPMLCYGRPETLAYYQRRIDRHIAGLEDSGGVVDTNRQVVTVCPWDAPIRCTCRWCRDAYDTKAGFAGRASPIVWERFARPLSAWLAARHPDYLLSFLPYLNYCAVPDGLRPPWWSSAPTLPNAEAEVCTMPGLALLKDPDVRAREEALIRDWHRVTGRKVLNWHYSCWPRDWTSAPYVFGRTIRRHYVDMADHVSGTFICGDPDDVRLTLSHYVWMKCLWNPDLDVEAVYDGFARRMFGPAAAPMRELVHLQEDGWERRWYGEELTCRNVFGASYPHAVAERMRALLREAHRRATAAGDAVAERRIARYAAGFAAFFAESDALERRRRSGTERPTIVRVDGTERPTIVRLGETNAMVVARSARHPVPWAETTVVTTREGDALVFTVRCAEPAAKTMDFGHESPYDHVWGCDGLEFVLSGGESHRVRAAGPADASSAPRWTSRVTHDDGSWTAQVRLRLTAAERAAGEVVGNVSRWRVGDRSRPREARVPGSRYEHSRLKTAYTQPNDDPAAFVRFRLRCLPADGGL